MATSTTTATRSISVGGLFDQVKSITWVGLDSIERVANMTHRTIVLADESNSIWAQEVLDERKAKRDQRKAERDSSAASNQDQTPPQES